VAVEPDIDDLDAEDPALVAAVVGLAPAPAAPTDRRPSGGARRGGRPGGGRPGGRD